jgi:hypothetical protein
MTARWGPGGEARARGPEHAATARRVEVVDEPWLTLLTPVKASALLESTGFQVVEDVDVATRIGKLLGRPIGDGAGALLTSCTLLATLGPGSARIGSLSIRLGRNRSATVDERHLGLSHHSPCSGLSRHA